jgi:hypothetical protein
MLFIVAQELHINCGMAYIMRYNVWIMPFMAFFNVYNIKPGPSTAVFGISGAWSLFIMILVTIVSTPNLNLDYTILGRFVINNFPSLYNPPVGIYYSRTLTEETYYCKFPVPYYDDEGNLRKILVTPEAEEFLDNGEWTIYDPSMQPVDFRDLPSTNINGEEFTYINITEDGYHMVRDMDTLDFSDLTQTDVSLIRTPMGYEGDNALVYGNRLHLLLHTMPGRYVGTFNLTNVFGGTQTVVVRVNGNVVYEGQVNIDDDVLSFEYEVGDDFVCDIDIDIPGAVSPMSVNPDSDDYRVLSLYFTEFCFTPAA